MLLSRPLIQTSSALALIFSMSSLTSLQALPGDPFDINNNNNNSSASRTLPSLQKLAAQVIEPCLRDDTESSIQFIKNLGQEDLPSEFSPLLKTAFESILREVFPKDKGLNSLEKKTVLSLKHLAAQALSIPKNDDELGDFMKRIDPSTLTFNPKVSSLLKHVHAEVLVLKLYRDIFSQKSPSKAEEDKGEQTQRKSRFSPTLRKDLISATETYFSKWTLEELSSLWHNFDEKSYPLFSRETPEERNKFQSFIKTSLKAALKGGRPFEISSLDQVKVNPFISSIMMKLNGNEIAGFKNKLLNFPQIMRVGLEIGWAKNKETMEEIVSIPNLETLRTWMPQCPEAKIDKNVRIKSREEIMRLLGKASNLHSLILPNLINQDLGFLTTLTNLRKLDIRNAYITNEGLKFVAAKFPNLTSFGARVNEITDGSPLENCKKLQDLDLSYTNITDLSFLKGPGSRLKTLNLDIVTPITSLLPLNYCLNLQELNLYGFKGSPNQLAVLAGLLDLHTLQLKAIGCVRGIIKEHLLTNKHLEKLPPNLYSLSLEDNDKVTDITPLAKLCHLQHLSLSCTKVGNEAVKILAESFPSLKTVDLYGTKVTDISLLKEKRPDIKVRLNFH